MLRGVPSAESPSPHGLRGARHLRVHATAGKRFVQQSASSFSASFRSAPGRGSSAHIPGRAWADRVRSLGRASIRVDAASTAAAVSAGFGVGAIVALYAAEHPNLVHVTSPNSVDARDLWILMPSDLVRVARVRTVWDFIVELASERPRRRGSSAARETRARN
jgi:hypothetical protein